MPRSTRCTLLAACAVLLIGVAAPAAAQVLTLESAIEQTIARNPELRVYAPRLKAARERVAAAALRPPFELQAETQDAFGTGRASGFDSAESTFALSQVIELGGKRGLRQDAANASAAVIDAERAAAELDVLAEVTRRFIHVAADQEQQVEERRVVERAGEQAAHGHLEQVVAHPVPDRDLRQVVGDRHAVPLGGLGRRPGRVRRSARGHRCQI